MTIPNETQPNWTRAWLASRKTRPSDNPGIAAALAAMRSDPDPPRMFGNAREMRDYLRQRGVFPLTAAAIWRRYSYWVANNTIPEGAFATDPRENADAFQTLSEGAFQDGNDDAA